LITTAHDLENRHQIRTDLYAGTHNHENSQPSIFFRYVLSRTEQIMQIGNDGQVAPPLNSKEYRMKSSILKDEETKRPALSDIKTLRKRARQDIEKGAVTPGYSADRKHVIKMLNEALATELVCVLRYKRHYFMASGIHAAPVAAEFLAHAAEEMSHADLIAKRIVELRGEPNFSPDGLSDRSHAEYVEGDSLKSMIEEDLIAERIAIESYREMVAYLGDEDSTTRRMLEGILASEEEHAEDLSSLLVGMKDYGKV
jgi:bacterioferritin